MRGLLATLKIGYRSNTVYRLNYFLSIIRSALAMAIPLLVWSALYEGNHVDVVAGRTLSQMIIYVLISRLCSAAVQSRFADKIEQKMKTGAIGYDFLRPQPARHLFIAQSLGDSATNFIATMIPFLLFAAVFFRDIEPYLRVNNIVFFTISLGLGLVIALLFEIVKGTLAFWFINVWVFDWFLDLFYFFLSGAFVPLWFFPDWLQTVARLLPFQAAFFLPVEQFLGVGDLTQSLASLCVQLLWVGVLFFLQQIMWRKGIKKIIILGG